jgi:hypothetical protein
MNRLFCRIILPLLLVAGSFFDAKSQTDSLIEVSGYLRDDQSLPIPISVIVVSGSNKGIFGNSDGSFSIQCKRQDTLLFTSFGFLTRTIALADSIWDVSKPITIFLDRRIYRYSTVQIFGQRDLSKIQDDIRKLGYDEKDYRLSGINALESPITFLYQQFSKTERSKRLVAEMENEDKKRELLKELFRIYIDYDIIQLDNKEFDAFIDYINISDEFLKSISQYDFILFVKERFQDYRIYIRRQQLEELDYQYDQD